LQKEKELSTPMGKIADDNDGKCASLKRKENRGVIAMGRKPKVGLDYFLCDVNWMNDRKFRHVKQKYGYFAPYLYQILLSLIYQDKGYYFDIKNKDDAVWEIQRYLHGRYSPDAETVQRLIDDLVACELFNRDLYENEHILTSRRVQEEYYNSTTKRRAVSIHWKYWLLSEEDMRLMSSNHIILQNFISDVKNKINDVNNRKDDGKSTQSREEKSRVEKSRIEKSEEEKNRADNDSAKKSCAEKNRTEGRLPPSSARTSGMKKTNLFTPPTKEEVQAYCAERGNRVDAERWFAYYEANGWHVGRNAMRDWKASVRSWESNGYNRPYSNPKTQPPQQQEPTGALQDWEKEWLAQFQKST
jgi:hypothetical protein